MADAVAVQDLIVGLPYRRAHHLRKHIAFEFTDAGHILGSASVDLRITEGGHPSHWCSPATSAGRACPSSAIPIRRPGRSTR